MTCAFNQTRQTLIASRVEKAHTTFSRMRGLLGKTSIDQEFGLWIYPCNSIHTFFMKFSIDVVFLSKTNQVIKIMKSVSPFRLSPIVWSAKSVLELSEGAITRGKLEVGDCLEFRS